MTRLKLIIVFSVWLLNLSSQTNWQQLGLSSPNSPDVYTMYTDTSTRILYVGGTFSDFGGVTTKGVTQWNGVKWDSLGGGIDNNSSLTGMGVYKILKYKGLIYAFGDFYKVGNLSCQSMARWNGLQWDTLIGRANGIILDADVYKDTLYVCGDFTQIGNITSNFAAKFDGTTWYPMSFPFNDQGPIIHIRAYKNKVYGTSNWYANGFGLTAEYTQQNGWQPSVGVQGNSFKTIFGLERVDTLLFFFGRFTHLSTMYSPDIAAWSGTQLYGFGGGVNPSTPSNSYIRSIQKINNKIYCVGLFDNANGLTNGINSLNIASLEGNQWCIYGDNFDNTITDLEVYNDSLIIGGGYDTINGVSNASISKWIGGTYTYSCNTFLAGLNEINLSENIKISPNPTTSIINILDEQNELQNSTIEIKNYLGQSVFSSPFTPQIDLSGLSAGMYFLTIQYKENRKTIKIIKQ